ncbi:hypothetical protein [Agrobacterium radiobacter]|uniref:hypothetical protein n=1 Tax=Agrobacterium radiobacter TaxID=362 RepID=UPI003CE550C9
MAAVADFLADKQLSEFERATVARCMSKPYAANEDTLLKVAEPYYRGDLVQLLEVLEGMSSDDAQAYYEIRRARDVGLGPSGSPKMHHGLLTARCRRLGITLPTFETRNIKRPT